MPRRPAEVGEPAGLLVGVGWRLELRPEEAGGAHDVVASPREGAGEQLRIEADAWWQAPTGRSWPRRFVGAVGCTVLVASVIGWVVAVPATRRWYFIHRHRSEAAVPARGWWARHVEREADDAARSRVTGRWKPGLTTRRVGWLLVVGFAAWAAACPFANHHRVGCWFLPPIALFSYVWLLRPRVVAGDDAVHVRNFVRTFSVGWAEVDVVRLVLRSPVQLVKPDGAVVKCWAGPVNALAVMQGRRSHADELADDLARRAAAYQGRTIDQVGGASTFSDEERTELAKEVGWRFAVSLVAAVLAEGD